LQWKLKFGNHKVYLLTFPLNGKNSADGPEYLKNQSLFIQSTECLQYAFASSVQIGGSELEGLFDNLLENKPVFKDKEVLRPSYTPSYLPHRRDQLNAIAVILVVALRGETPSNILIYGKTGTGKTACAKYVGRELTEVGASRGVPCNVAYINCEVIDTQYRVLAYLARQFDKDVPMTGWPTDQVYSQFIEALDSQSGSVIIILDELDKLVRKSGDDVLYNLSRINLELANTRVSLIGISNDLKFTEYLDPRVRSSLAEEEIIFPPYDSNQLRDILEERARIAFKEHALNPEVIPLCAALAAQEHGDARRALDLLRVSGEFAERVNADSVKEEHVRTAQKRIELNRVAEVIRTLPTQAKLVLYSIIALHQNGARSATTGEVNRVYETLCRQIELDVLTKRRITDLIMELDLLGIISTKVVSKGRYGRTKEISLSVPVDETFKVLLEDYRLEALDGTRFARRSTKESLF
jgi:archaeal cell division control protein 6